jgi:hypothetical protein
MDPKKLVEEMLDNKVSKVSQDDHEEFFKMDGTFTENG